MFSADDILIYFLFFIFLRKRGSKFHANRRQFACNVKSCFSGKYKKTINNFSSAELAKRVLKVKASCGDFR